MLAVNVHNKTQDKTLENIFQKKLRYHVDMNHDSLERLVVSAIKDTLHHWKCKKELTYSVVKDVTCQLSCGICFDKFKKNEHKIKLSCGHEFHRRCISKWVYALNYSTCPQCNSSIYTD